MLKMHAHASKVARDENSIVIRRDCQDVRIEGAVWNHNRGSSKVNRGLPSEQTLPDVRINVSVGLEADLQASRGGVSFFARSIRSVIS